MILRSLAGSAALVALVAGAPWVAAAAGPRAQPAPPDTALDRFLGGLSDSTEAYFGLSAARPDTAGLDSALAYGLAHPQARGRRPRRPSFGPDLGFNRVDGPRYGAVAAIGEGDGPGRLEGRLEWASGPNDLRGGAKFLRTLYRDDVAWSLRLSAGRRTDGMDRDFGDLELAMLGAFVTGRDYTRYLRRDGFEASLARESATWRAEAGFRDLLETPLATRATWNLTKASLAVVDNLAASPGRNLEFTLEAAARWPGTSRPGAGSRSCRSSRMEGSAAGRCRRRRSTSAARTRCAACAAPRGAAPVRRSRGST